LPVSWLILLSIYFVNLNKDIDENKLRRFTSALGGAGVAVTGFLLAVAAFFVADVAVADVFLSVMLEFYLYKD
jgi:hypothetical protein